MRLLQHPVAAVADLDHHLTVRLRGKVDAAGMQKEMLISLAASGTEITIDHTLTVGDSRDAAAWSLSLVPLLLVTLAVLFRWVEGHGERAA